MSAPASVESFHDSMQQSLSVVAREFETMKETYHKRRREIMEGVKTKTPVVYIQVLGEENASQRAYVLAVSDLPGGDLTILKQQLAILGGRGRILYKNFEPCTDRTEADGDIITGWIEKKTPVHAFTSMEKLGYTPSADEELVYVTAAFENI